MTSKGFIAWLKAHPDKALMGTAGAGAGQVNGFLFQKMTGTRLQFVRIVDWRRPCRIWWRDRST